MPLRLKTSEEIKLFLALRSPFASGNVPHHSSCDCKFADDCRCLSEFKENSAEEDLTRDEKYEIESRFVHLPGCGHELPDLDWHKHDFAAHCAMTGVISKRFKSEFYQDYHDEHFKVQALLSRPITNSFEPICRLDFKGIAMQKQVSNAVISEFPERFRGRMFTISRSGEVFEIPNYHYTDIVCFQFHRYGVVWNNDAIHTREIRKKILTVDEILCLDVLLLLATKNKKFAKTGTVLWLAEKYVDEMSVEKPKREDVNSVCNYIWKVFTDLEEKGKSDKFDVPREHFMMAAWEEEMWVHYMRGSVGENSQKTLCKGSEAFKNRIYSILN